VACPWPLFAQADTVGANKRKTVPTQQKTASTTQRKAVSTQKKTASTTRQKPVSTPKKSISKSPENREIKGQTRNDESMAKRMKSGGQESAVSVVEKELSKTQGALDSIKVELERGRLRFKELQSEEGNYLSRLEQIEKNISSSGRYAELVQRQIDTAELVLKALGDSLVRAEADLSHARELMKKRLRSAYMVGDVSRLRMLLTSGDPAEFVRRARYFQDLNRYDKRLAASIKDGIASVNEKKSAHGANRDRLVKLLEDKKKEQQALVAEEAQRRAVLSDIRTKKSAHEAMVAELEEARNELDALMKVLEGRRKKAKEEEAERRAAVSFENSKGKLPWPLRGEVVRKFGNVVHPVYKTVTPNNGIDIAAKKGAPVSSVAQGDVALVKWMRGYGRCVFIDHGGGFYTLYAHLDEVSVKENSKITAGAEIGKAGETGTTGGVKLHFEVKRRAESLNPEEWLEKINLN
jgi:septal ring factor EnvC (AmiA/AmiB activator)